jgi:hypothetical protein
MNPDMTHIYGTIARASESQSVMTLSGVVPFWRPAKFVSV